MADEQDYFSELRKYHKPGYKLKRFRRPSKAIVINRFLYGLMFADNITTTELAEKIGVSRSTVQKWIFEGRIPRTKERQHQVAAILSTTPKAIFNERDIIERLQLLEEKRESEEPNHESAQDETN